MDASRYGSGVTKGGVAYSYAGPGTIDTTKGGGVAKGGGFTKGGVAYSYGPGPTTSQLPASRSANPQHYPSQNYHSGYGAPSTAIYHYAHGHSPPSPLVQQYAPTLQQQHAIVSPLPPPPQYAPPQYAPPRDAPLQYAPVNTLQTIHPPVYHPARGGRVSSGRVVSSERVESSNRVETPPRLPGGPSWPHWPPAPQGPPRQDAPLQYTPQQDAPPQDAPRQHTARHDDTYDHAAVRAAAGRAAVGRATAVHTTPGTVAQVAPPPPLPVAQVAPPPVARMQIGSISSRVVGVNLRHVNGREAAEMVSSHDGAHASGQAVASDDLARFQQRLGLSARQPRGYYAPPSPPQQHHRHTTQHCMHHTHAAHAPLEGRVFPATLGDPHDAVSLADALAASSQHARISPVSRSSPSGRPPLQRPTCLLRAASWGPRGERGLTAWVLRSGCGSAPLPCPNSRVSPRLWLISTQACDLCERLAASILEVSPGFSAQVADPPLEPQVGA
jgi:hypothetical protein